MVKFLLVICLALFGCQSTRNHYGYEVFTIDKERQKSLDEDFDSYLNYFTELDSSRDGYYLVYDLRFDAVVPDAFLLFYGGDDSISICPFGGKSAACKEYEINRKDFPDKSLKSAESFFPNGFSQDTTKRIYGFKKEKNERKYYTLYQMDTCYGNQICKENGNAFIQENFKQYSINAKIFNRFSYLVTSLYEFDVLNENWQSGVISKDLYEKIKRNILERQSDLEREYRDLLAEKSNEE